MVKTHYDNLQVTRNASPEVIKGAYKYLAQKWHPDKNLANKDKAARVLLVINRAHEVLSDPQLRKKHDDWIAQQESDVAASKHAPSAAPDVTVDAMNLKPGNVYLVRDGQQFGPFSIEESQRYILEGRFRAQDLAWIDGM